MLCLCLACAFICADLANQRDVMERTLAAELMLCEKEHEDHASSLRTGGMSEAMDLQRQLDACKLQHRRATAQLEEDLIREKRVNAEAAIKIGELDMKVSQVREENARLEGTWKAEVDDLRNEAKANASRNRGMHASEIARLEAAFLRVVNEKEAVERKCEAKQKDLEATTRQMEANDAANQLRIEEAIAAGQVEAARLQREVDKGKALHTAALAAGSYKGRQMLYMDSLKSPAPRANTPEALRRDGSRSSLSWRGLEEVHHLTRAMVGQAAADRMRELDDDNAAPSGFVPNPAHEALGEHFGSGDGEREVVHRMLKGDFSAATGLVSHASPYSRMVMQQTPGRVPDVP